MGCDLGNITVHYETRGKGRPIIFLHGWGLLSSGLDWLLETEPFFENKNGWQRIYIDLPGMGKTPGADWITGSEDIVDLLIKFVDKLLPNQKVSLIGYSWGGYLAQGIIYKQPEIVDGLCLVAPVTRARSDRILPKHKILLEDNDVLEELEPEGVEFFRNFFVVQNRKTVDIHNKYIQRNMLADKEFLDRIDKKYIFPFDVEILPETFDKPTLIISGRQDSSTGYQQPWAILENYPRASFVVLDKAGHGLIWEHGKLLLLLIDEWLDRIKEAIS